MSSFFWLSLLLSIVINSSLPFDLETKLVDNPTAEALYNMLTHKYIRWQYPTYDIVSALFNCRFVIKVRTDNI